MGFLDDTLTKPEDGPGRRLANAVAFGLRRRWANLRGAHRGNRALHRQPLISDTLRLYRWARAAPGSADKPRSTGEIPWEYVERNRDQIPFFGLKEYWYPLALSREVDDRAPHAFTICGEEIVAYRTPDGRPVAMANRCPHRNVLLSAGQLNVVEPGTLTCRYHGVTLNPEGRCIAILADGPNSRSCRHMNVRTYPLDEAGDVVWIYMGKKTPRGVREDMPKADEVLARKPFVHRLDVPTSHLNVLDNQFDLAHPSVLHRTCAPFSAQRLWGNLEVTPRGDYGFHASYSADSPPNPGDFFIKEIEWHLPNIAYFPPGSLSGKAFQGSHGGFHIPVPHTIDSCTVWFLFSRPDKMNSPLNYLLPGSRLPIPGGFRTCVLGGDVAMMISSGPVVKWDDERLISTDVTISRARRLMCQKHREELAANQ